MISKICRGLNDEASLTYGIFSFFRRPDTRNTVTALDSMAEIHMARIRRIKSVSYHDSFADAKPAAWFEHAKDFRVDEY